MPRRNRVDPFGDLHAVPDRGMFTGNRGCLVDGAETVVRHHRGDLWITCVTAFRGRRVGMARPGRWTPVFFLDDAVALAAGHPTGHGRPQSSRTPSPATHLVSAHATRRWVAPAEGGCVSRHGVCR